MWTVKETAEITGVSVRTLHYYDEIGLLSPGKITDSGYRLYGKAELRRLQEILFYRELEFPLREIKELLKSGQPQEEALKKQRELLKIKRNRLTRLIRLTGQLLKGDEIMSFQEFDNTQLEKKQREYANEVKARWGNTRAYEEAQKKTAGRTRQEQEKLQEQQMEISQSLAASMEKGPSSPEAQAQIQRWREFLTAHYYECTPEILAGLGELYRTDPRFRDYYEAIAPGLADFLADAIALYSKGND